MLKIQLKHFKHTVVCLLCFVALLTTELSLLWCLAICATILPFFDNSEAKKPEIKYLLEDLLAQCGPENRHQEIDFGIEGKELI